MGTLAYFFVIFFKMLPNVVALWIAMDLLMYYNYGIFHDL